MKKFIAIVLATIFGAVLTSSSVLATSPISGSSEVVASVTVHSWCGLDIDNAAITFNNVQPNTNDNPADKTVTAKLDSNTNTLTTVTIGGGAWCSGVGCPGTPTYSMPVGQTKYSLTGISPWTQLTSSATLFTSSTPSDAKTTTFVLDVPIAQTAASYGQTIIFGFSC